jgi:hypothetical protein
VCAFVCVCVRVGVGSAMLSQRVSMREETHQQIFLCCGRIGLVLCPVKRLHRPPPHTLSTHSSLPHLHTRGAPLPHSPPMRRNHRSRCVGTPAMLAQRLLLVLLGCAADHLHAKGKGRCAVSALAGGQPFH